MSLSGIDPADPVPGTFRELVLGAGTSSGPGKTRDVIIYGNKTDDGSESTNAVGTPVLDGNDARARMGARSELYNEWLKYVAIDKDATTYFVAVPEPSGSQATLTITFSGAATKNETVDVFWGGSQTSFAVLDGDDETAMCTALAGAINSADEGTWPFVAEEDQPDVDVTAANFGDRGGYALGQIRVVPRSNIGATISYDSVSDGGGTDDFTAAYAAVDTAGLFYYQVSPKTADSSVTSTDNGVGEHVLNINTQANPLGGKGQQVFFGLTGSNADAITVATSANAARAKFVWSENSPWTPGMLAAHNAAAHRSQEIVFPSANMTGYRNTDSTVYQVPAPYSKADWPTRTEIKAALNNGVSPIAFSTRGAAYLVRSITSRSLNGTANDYRCREGHIPSAIDFSWDAIAQKYEETKQPLIDDDLPQGSIPRPRTTYPNAVAAMIRAMIDDLCGPAPLGGAYNAPILNPSSALDMKESVKAKKIQGGVFASGDLKAVEHNNKAEFLIREVSGAQ